MTTATLLDPNQARAQILGKGVRGAITVEGKLDLSGRKELKSLPSGLNCFELDASRTSLDEIPADLKVECKLVLQHCKRLKSLPEKLSVGTLDVRGCTALSKLPEGLDVWFLDARECSQLAMFPQRARIQNGGLNVSRCERLQSLPSYLRKLATLDISDCPSIRNLPRNLQVGLWIDVGGSGVTGPTEKTSGTGWRWRGVPIDERIAFSPAELKASDALSEKNAERRRVIIERMGFDRFVTEAGAKVLNKDMDPGGERRLLRVPLENDEDIVCLSCYCPSTGRHYVLRVPPTIKKCHDAAAWIAGFEDPKKYRPVLET